MAEPVTTADCVTNAIRLLQAAEVDTNLAQMEALTRLAETWLTAATLTQELE